MMTQETNTRSTQLQELCAAVRKYSIARDYQKCAAMICKAMQILIGAIGILTIAILGYLTWVLMKEE